MDYKLDTKVLDRIIRDNPDNLSRFLVAEAGDMAKDMQDSMGTSPSAPGSPPGVDTGALHDSIQVEAEGKFRVVIHDGVPHGIFMEWGTSTIAPRPFFGPVFEKYRARFAEDAKRWGLLK